MESAQITNAYFTWMISQNSLGYFLAFDTPFPIATMFEMVGQIAESDAIPNGHKV